MTDQSDKMKSIGDGMYISSHFGDGVQGWSDQLCQMLRIKR